MRVLNPFSIPQATLFNVDYFVTNRKFTLLHRIERPGPDRNSGVSDVEHHEQTFF